MKKILIVSQAMEIGGAEKALLGLLESIDTSKFQVELYLLRHSGELLEYIPRDITLLPENEEYSMLAIPLMKTLVHKKYYIFFSRLIGKVAANTYVRKNKIKDGAAIKDEYSHKYTVNCMPMISDKIYDLAISFLAPHYFVIHKVNAKKKVAWIHTDYETMEIDVNSELNMWSPYDYIASISEDVTKSFLKTFPLLSNKMILFENIMPTKYMSDYTDYDTVIDEMPYDGSIALLSIGRFCTAKNFDNIPDICRRIIDAGFNVRWYLIGYGADEELIQSKIKEFNMEEYVCILGKKENPYPYIKRCDFYIQPSRYEGKCISVIEAQMFHKPVIITKYATSASQLKDGFDGVIVPRDNEGCANGIIEVLKNLECQLKIIENCAKSDFSNSKEINKLQILFEKNM